MIQNRVVHTKNCNYYYFNNMCKNATSYVITVTVN